MSWSSSLLLATLAGLCLAFTVAMSKPIAAPTPTNPLPPAYPIQPNATATRLLDEALAVLDPQRMPWIRTTIWQQGHLPPWNFQTKGSFLTGPGHRFRLDLQIKTGSNRSWLALVCDGQTLWQAEHLGPSRCSISRLDLPCVLTALHLPDAVPAVREEFYQAHLYFGPVRLLQRLRHQLLFTHQEPGRWEGNNVVILTGVQHQIPPDQLLPPCLPRLCRLFLDAQTSWPCRLEWWGPPEIGSADVLLLQEEFREPVLGKPMTEREFTFQPGAAVVTDRTAYWTDKGRNR